jgi:hypothetical protein
MRSPSLHLVTTWGFRAMAHPLKGGFRQRPAKKTWFSQKKKKKANKTWVLPVPYLGG